MRINSRSPISVCIATYNGEKYLWEQLVTLCEDLREYDEIVVSDNCSTDKTLEIVSRLQDGRIKVFTFEAQGVNFNFENAIRHASNEYIFFCDQDDIWHPGKRDRCMEVLGGCDLLMHNAFVRGSASRRSQLFESSVKLDIKSTIVVNKFTGCCMVGRRSFLLQCLPLPNKVPYFDQWIAVNAIARRVSYTFVNEALITHRRHDRNTSSLLKKSSQRVRHIILQRLYLLFIFLKIRLKE